MKTKLDYVPREALDSLANAYWMVKNLHFSALSDAADKAFDIDKFHASIDRDPFWDEACGILEPGMRAGLTTSLTVCESITRKNELPNL